MPWTVRELTATSPVEIPPPGDVHVWQFVLDLCPFEEHEVRSALLPAEAERAGRYKAISTGRQFALGRGALRIVLGRCLGLAPTAVEIIPDVDGKPHSPGIEFNISHSAGGCLIVVSRSPVGVDVEEVRDRPTAAGLVERYFAPEERRQFAAIQEGLKQAAFHRGWTCKEAVLKADGRGARGLEICAVNLDPRTPPGVVKFDDRTWDLICWEPWPGFMAAGATIGLARPAKHSDNPPPVPGTRRFP